MKKSILGFVVVTSIAVTTVLTSCFKTVIQESSDSTKTETQTEGSSFQTTEKWEYKIVELKKLGDLEVKTEKENELNRLGAEGWELVSIGSPASGGANSKELYGILKRKIQ